MRPAHTRPIHTDAHAFTLQIDASGIPDMAHLDQQTKAAVLAAPDLPDGFTITHLEARNEWAHLTVSQSHSPIRAIAGLITRRAPLVIQVSATSEAPTQVKVSGDATPTLRYQVEYAAKAIAETIVNAAKIGNALAEGETRIDEAEHRRDFAQTCIEGVYSTLADLDKHAPEPAITHATSRIRDELTRAESRRDELTSAINKAHAADRTASTYPQARDVITHSQQAIDIANQIVGHCGKAESIALTARNELAHRRHTED